VSNTNASSPIETSAVGWQPPELPENCQDVTIIWGGNFFGIRIADLNKTHFEFAGNGDPFVLNVKSNRFYVGFDMTNKDVGLVKVRGNTSSPQLPQAWDMNMNSNALEIVTGKSVPIFQLFYRRPDEVAINGVFQLGGRFWFASEKELEWFGCSNQVIGDNMLKQFEEQTSRNKPIFKYPAWRYPGEYAD